MNFGRYLNTGSLTDPIAVGGDALAPLIRMFNRFAGNKPIRQCWEWRRSEQF